MKYVSGTHPTIVILVTSIVLPVPSTTISTPPSSQPQTNNDERVLTICTHDGVFHADEALACYMLKVLYPNAQIVRSRDPTVHASSDIVLDVGMIYDPERNRYDHHQQNFTETMSSLSSVLRSSIRLSSAGLIYHHFGRAVLQKLTGETDTAALDYLYKMVYYALIQECDGIDNGIPQHPTRSSYNIATDLSARVSRLNKPPLPANEWNVTMQFNRAMELAGTEFKENVDIILHQEYPTRGIVQRAFEKRYDVHPSGLIVVLDQYCPWENHIFEIEDEKNIRSQIKFVVFPTQSSEYDVQCVPKTSRAFDCRKSLPKSWRGLEGEKLSRQVGIEGCVFTHANGFIGGHLTRDGALQMAAKALLSDDY